MQNHGWRRRFSRVGLEAVQIALGQAVAVAGGLAGIRLLTSLLSPVQYGELTLSLTAGALLIQATFGPLQQGALRFFGPAREAQELGACLRAMWRLVWRTGPIIVITASVMVLAMSAAGYASWIGLAIGSFAFAVLSGCERILDALQAAGRQRAVTAWHQGLAQWLRFLIASALIVWWHAASSVALTGYVVATALVLASQYFFFWIYWHPVLSIESASAGAVQKWQTRIWQYARPFVSWGVFSWLQQSSDRWALQTFSTTSDVGYYSVLFQLGYTPILLVTGVIIQLVQPIVFNRSGDGTDVARMTHAKGLSQRLLYGFLALAIAAALVAFVAHPLVFRWLVAPQYRPVSWLMPWMVLSGGLFACGELAALTLLSGLQTQRLRRVKIGAAVIGMTMNVVGAWWLGLAGVVFASLGFSLVSLTWTFLASVPSARPSASAPPSIERAGSPITARSESRP
jgi:O-antigen/teichoic acid export membrane protein